MRKFEDIYMEVVKRRTSREDIRVEELPESIAKGLAEREQSKVLIASLKKRDNFKAGARLQKLVVQLQDRRKESK